MRQRFLNWFRPGSDVSTEVVEVHGAPIAHFTVRGHQLIHLFVDPSHQRMGLGRQLLLKAEATIAAAGHDTLELHVRVDNPAAIAFYERAGWVMTDRTILTIEHGISYYEYVLAEHHV